MLDFADLRVFARIIDAGTISAAARALRLPKSSVSRSLVRLERAVGAVLVERSTRGLRLTDAGRLLQRHVRRILDDVSEAEAAVGGLTGPPRGTLRVSAAFTFAAGPLAPMLPAFLARYPAVRVVLSFDSRAVNPLDDDFDVAIRVGPQRDSDLIARRLATIGLVLCSSPAYLRRRGTPASVGDLPGHDLITVFDRPYPWRFRTRSGDLLEIEVPPGTVIPEPAVARTVLLGGAGIGRLPDYYATDLIANGALVRLLPELEGDTVEAYALYPAHRSLSAKVRVFVDALTEHLAAR